MGSNPTGPVFLSHFACNINKSVKLMFVGLIDVVRLSKNQKQILEILEIRPDMTTKEIAETVFGKLVKYKTKEYSSAMRSLVALEKQGLIQRVQVQLRWRRSSKKSADETNSA